MIKSWGAYTFIFFAVLDVIIGIVVLFFVKETKGLSLEEMETVFRSKAAFDVAAARTEGLEIEPGKAVEAQLAKGDDSV